MKYAMAHINWQVLVYFHHILVEFFTFLLLAVLVGMLEKALFYSEYQNVNSTGEECKFSFCLSYSLKVIFNNLLFEVVLSSFPVIDLLSYFVHALKLDVYSNRFHSFVALVLISSCHFVNSFQYCTKICLIVNIVCYILCYHCFF